MILVMRRSQQDKVNLLAPPRAFFFIAIHCGCDFRVTLLHVTLKAFLARCHEQMIAKFLSSRYK